MNSNARRIASNHGFFGRSAWLLASFLIVFCLYLLLFMEPQKLKMLAPATHFAFKPRVALETFHEETTILPVAPRQRKKILVYTTLFGSRSWSNMPEGDLSHYLERSKCKITDCDITYNKAELSSSDALVFHARDMQSPQHLRSLTRPISQRWVYFISENPHNTPDPTSLNGLFNWTMTYRLDSDLYLPYGQFGPVEAGDVIPSSTFNHAEGKPKLVAWMVSHCGLVREEFVLKLQDHIPIDVGGGCKGRYKRHLDCDRSTCPSVVKQYKFYLSFENGFCQNYVTEKYWQWGIEGGSVPIVMGGGPYNDSRLVIPGSFINVEDYSSVKELADYLLYLDKNDTAYNSYFKWKQTYKVTVSSHGWPFEPDWTCRMCQMLHNSSYEETKVYDNLSTFWGSGPSCSNRDAVVRKMIQNA